jgi:pyruvate/2-oxoglutarate dehydrogenase complex dihydrolipoamide dehydrogenase (E3) component
MRYSSETTFVALEPESPGLSFHKSGPSESPRKGIDMPNIERYDFLIIGSGEAGKYTAWAFASAGHRTAVVERKLVGGSCPNIACLPSKNIIRSAKVASFARRGAEFGLEIGSLAVNMAGVQRRKRNMVAEMVQDHLDRYKASGAELIMGTARFIAARTVEVALRDGGTRQLTGDRVLLNVGTRATIPDIPGLAESRPMTHIEALDLDRLPGHLIVLGGGYVGLELAQAMRRFGARVTLIEQGEHIASREDADVGAALLELFQSEGIEVLLKTRIASVEGLSGQQVRVHIQDDRGARVLEGSDLLIATGRTPNTDGLNLERAGVQLTPQGFVQVNERLETSAPNVWAMGDCAGSPFFTHVAFDDFRVIRDNLNGGNRTTRDRFIPFCMFTDPELARVGLNETEAKARGIAYRVVKIPMTSVLRMHTIAETRGFSKMLIAADSDRILGFTAFGAEASEMMAAVQVAMLAGMPYTTLRDTIFTHPTAAEGLTVLLAKVPPKEARKAA